MHPESDSIRRDNGLLPPKPSNEGLMNSCFRLLSRLGGVVDPMKIMVRASEQGPLVATVIASRGRIYEAEGVGRLVNPEAVFQAVFPHHDAAVFKSRGECRRADRTCFRLLAESRILSGAELETYMLKCLAETFLQLVDVGGVSRSVLERIPLDTDLEGFPSVKPFDIMTHIIEAQRASHG